MKYSNELIEKVRDLLSKGFNSVEIANKLNKHEVTIRNIKSQLKKDFSERQKMKADINIDIKLNIVTGDLQINSDSPKHSTLSVLNRAVEKLKNELGLI